MRGVERLSIVAHDLAQRLGGTWAVRKRPATIDRGFLVELRSSVMIDLAVDGETIAVRLEGDASPSVWISGALASLDELAAIARLVDDGRSRLTCTTLVPGARYEVLADIQVLRAGMTVRFVLYDDVDNHFGRLEFESDSGEKLTIEGDFSTPDHPAARVHRYLRRA